MSIKLIALDLDDTLVDDRGEVVEEAKGAIRRAREKGVAVTIATGRMYRSAQYYAEELGVDVPLITYNGALIKSGLSGKTLFHKPFPLELCLDVARYAKKRDLSLNIYIDDELRVEKFNEEVEYYEELVGIKAVRVGDLEEHLNGLQAGGGAAAMGSTKLLIVTDPDTAAASMKELGEIYRDRLKVTKSKPKFVEMIHLEVSKARAIAYLCEYLGIGPGETMAIGDSLNDLEMIEYAGIGVAVANGSDSLKRVADAVTKAPGGYGVAEAIEEFAL